MVGGVRRPGARQAGRDGLPGEQRPEDRGIAGAAGAGPARDRGGLSLPPGPAAERRRELTRRPARTRRIRRPETSSSGSTTSAPAYPGNSTSGASSGARSSPPTPICWPPSPPTTTRSCCSSPRWRTRMSRSEPRRSSCGSRGKISRCRSAVFRSPRPGSGAATSGNSTCCRRARSCWRDPGVDPAAGNGAAAGPQRPQHAAGPATGRRRGDTRFAAGRDSQRRRGPWPRAPRPTCCGVVPMFARPNSRRRHRARRWA